MRLSPLDPLDRWLAPAPNPRKVAWLSGTTFAHRGLHGPGVPENSLAAVRAAVEQGLGIECDVQRAGDGQAVVFHDWELERLTGGSGSLAALTPAQFAQLRLLGTAEAVPTLRQVLDTVAGRTPLLIELKSRRDRRIDALCLAVHRVLEGYRGPHAVMSFDPRVSRWFARHAPLTARGLVITEDNDQALPGRLRRHFDLWIARPDFLAYDVRDLPSRFAAAQRRRGLPLATWTVNSRERAERARRHADAPIAEGVGIG
ncbi:MAG: glycerophosphodiester phosphodiesterase [Novosphingobium sp.]|nr:glycerophosphodiester phosphodiesterase [Novosphingobium sp.]